MSSNSTIKPLLKKAKEAIASKNYRDALVQCKEVLAYDRACYEAYVLVGKAAFFLTEYTQAEAAYKRASDLDGTSPLAWQGFAELYTETGQWAQAASTFAALVRLAGASAGTPLHARVPAFLRKQADAAARAGDFSQAEQCYKELLTNLQAADAGASDSGGSSGGGSGDEERLELWCLLADCQLGNDRAEVEARVQARLASGEFASEAAVRAEVEAEWAQEGLEMESDHASSTLRDIIARAPPSPRYVPYYDAYLRRLRKYAYSAPAGSMEKHNRRVAALHFSKLMMEGRSVGDQGPTTGAVGGCCSPYAFVTALDLLEIEAEEGKCNAGGATGAGHHHPEGGGEESSTDHSGVGLALKDIRKISKRLAHAFPWHPAAGVHVAMALRRRTKLGLTPAYASTSHQHACARTSSSTVGAVTVMPAGGIGSGGCGGGSGGERVAADERRHVIRELMAGLKRGVPSIAGWVCAADMLLEAHEEAVAEARRQGVVLRSGVGGGGGAPRTGSAQAAVDAAREGLRVLAQRDLVGHESMEQAGLLLRLMAARSLLALGAHAEAEALFASMADRVSEGLVMFGVLAGVQPFSASQHAIRLLAQSLLERGERAGARRLYEEAVGREALGRSAVAAEPWAHAEYGWMMLQEGETGVAAHQLELAVRALESGVCGVGGSAREPRKADHKADHFKSCAADPNDEPELADYRLRLAQVYWALGGARRDERGAGAHAALLAAAAVRGPQQAGAFCWLGRWYADVAHDTPRAIKCYQRSLALDPTQPAAGEGLVALLVASGRADVALDLCRETAEASTLAQWPWRCMGGLMLRAGDAAGAVGAYQRALRALPDNAALWEGLAAAYEVLGRHTAAIKAYGRALTLQPGRLYCLLQAGSLNHKLGDYPAADASFAAALVLSPGHPVALLGAAESKLASASAHARMGAYGICATELCASADAARECGRRHGNVAAAWKLLGDALLQHAGVTPHERLAALAAAPPGSERAAQAAGGLEARADALRGARQAYARALHLDPTQGALWGDACTTACQEASLMALIARAPCAPGRSPVPPELVAALQSLARRLAAGGLRLEPANDALWAVAGVAAAGDSSQREYCWVRCLSLNPKRAPTWAALGRLYASAGAGHLARRCFEAGRSHEPTATALWEGMGHLAGSGSRSPGDAGHVDALDAYEHAVGLGGGLESRLAYAAHAVSMGTGGQGEVLASATKALHQLPTLPAAHNVLGLAAEARGHTRDAAGAYETGLALLEECGGAATESSGDMAADMVYLGVGPVGSGGGGMGGDPRSHASLSLALRLNLARALAKLGYESSDAAKRAVVMYEALEVEGALQGDAMAWLAYAGALQHSNSSSSSGSSGSNSGDRVTAALQAALAVATSSPSQGSSGGAGTVALTCALTLTKRLVATRQWALAEAVVRQHGGAPAACACDGELAGQLWLTLLAALTAAAAATSPKSPPPPGMAVPAPVMMGGGARVGAAAAAAAAAAPPGLLEVLPGELAQWAAANAAHVDGAQLAAVCASIAAAGAAARGRPVDALRNAASAVHAAPWDARWRLGLSSAAACASPSYALASSRSAPRETICAASAPGSGVITIGRLAPLAPLAPPPPLVPPPLPMAMMVAGGGINGIGIVPSSPQPAPGSALSRSLLSAARAPALSPSHPGDAHMLRASGLLATLPAPQLRAHFAGEVKRLTHLVHTQPSANGVAWYLMALVSLQEAASTPGVQCRLFRQTLVRCKVALARVQALHAALSQEATEAAAAAAAQPTSPSPPLAAATPLAAMMAAAAAAKTKSARGASAEKGLASLAASMLLRLLAATSEAYLHSRLPDAGKRAKDMATEALRWALNHELNPALAHRQLGRVHWQLGDLGNADVSLSQACKSGDACALSDYATLLAATGREAGALELVRTATGGGSGGQPGKAHLLSAAALAPAKILLQLGDLQAARTLLVDTLLEGGPPPDTTGGAVGKLPAGSVAAALALQARVALALAHAANDSDAGAQDPDPAAAKRLVLEARWAAGGALRELQAHPGSTSSCSVGAHVAEAGSTDGAHCGGSSEAALATLLLAQAELARGQADKGAEGLGKAVSMWEHPAPPDLVAQLVDVRMALGGPSGITPECGQALLAGAVLAEPWIADYWTRLHAAVGGGDAGGTGAAS
ncbi:hypothetical protein FOA52_000537 [Chlamydomonas sp. UWO 241]|nr:hypothetical protein FOA52_000537 [Chlamydomonas sp. UWO 241]